MNISCNSLSSSAGGLTILLFSIFYCCVIPALAAPISYPAQMTFHSSELPLNPFRQPLDPWRSKVVKWPEYYIDPTLKHGLSLLLPTSVRQAINIDANYDRWHSTPILDVDCFLSLQSWKDKCLFLAPRVSLTSDREAISLGGGIRHLINDRMMIGFHAFHDWVRGRNVKTKFLKDVAVGLEISALPGRYSDLIFSFNAHFPVNSNFSQDTTGDYIITETLVQSAEAKLGFLLPAMVNWIDARIDGLAEALSGDQTSSLGYKFGLTVNTRDGLLTGRLEHGWDLYGKEHFNVSANLALTFDWPALLDLRNPFSAPYGVPDSRYNRDLSQSMTSRVRARLDLPVDQTVTRIALATSVYGNAVWFAAGFPDLPNTRLTIQTAQSPWIDRSEAITDSRGSCKGMLKLKPGTYKIRLIHKPSGRVSDVQTIVIGKHSTQ
jgi:hypothetical protein